MITIFDDTELQTILVDQMAHHAYNPDVLELVNKKRAVGGQHPYDDPEDLLLERRWSIRRFVEAWQR